MLTTIHCSCFLHHLHKWNIHSLKWQTQEGVPWISLERKSDQHWVQKSTLIILHMGEKKAHHICRSWGWGGMERQKPNDILCHRNHEAFLTTDKSVLTNKTGFWGVVQTNQMNAPLDWKSTAESATGDVSGCSAFILIMARLGLDSQWASVYHCIDISWP